MPENEPSSFGPPQVQDRRLKPPGVLPRNTQGWVIGGIALVMVVVIAFSGGNAPKEKKAALQPPPATDPNQARIQEYRTRIEEQARKLQLEQAQLAQTKQALGLVPNAAPGATASASNESYPAGAYARPGTPAYGSHEPSSDRDWLQGEKEKRNYRSLFASNVVLSYRKDAQGHTEGATSTATPPAAANSPALYGYPYPVPPLAPGAPPEPALGTPAAEEKEAGTRPESAERARKIRTQEPDLSRAEGKNYRLFEGKVIETVLTNRLDGSFSGPVNCMVTTNVYSHNRQRLLIPQGSRVLGEVSKVDRFGQQRLAVFFHRLIMPDGYSVSLDQFQGLNQIGETGLRDQVNHHYMQVFGVSLAIGAIAGLAQANTRYGLDASAEDAYRQGVAASLSQSSLRILDRYLNVLPTFTIREGHRVKVYLSDDLLLPAYEKHQMPEDL